MEDVEENNTCENNSNSLLPPETEIGHVAITRSAITLSTATISGTDVSEDENLETKSIKEGHNVFESKATSIDETCADRRSIANTMENDPGVHEIEQNLQIMNEGDLSSNAVAEKDPQQVIEQLPFSAGSSCKTEPKDFFHDDCNIKSSSSGISVEMQSVLVDLNAIDLISAQPQKPKPEKHFDHPSDSDSTTSLVSRVKNPKKRRTTRVEYRPRARVSSYRVRATVSAAPSRHRFGRKHLSGKIEKGRGRIGTLQPSSRLPLRDGRMSRDCKGRSTMGRYQRSLLSNIASRNSVSHSDMQLKYATKYYDPFAFKGNDTKFSDKMCEILNSQDEFDVEIEYIIDKKNGVDMKCGLRHSDEESIAASISQSLSVNDLTLHEIPNSSKSMEDFCLKPEDYNGIEQPGYDARANQSNDSSNSEPSVMQRSVRKRLQLHSRSNKSEATGILRRKRFADCRLKGDEEAENQKIVKTNLGLEGNFKSVPACATDAFLSASFNLNNADGNSLTVQGDSLTNQRFSARLRQIQTQKSVFSLNSTVNAFLKNGHHPETKISLRSPSISSYLFPLHGNGTSSIGQPSLQLSSDGATFCDNSICTLISPEAHDDPIIRERYDFAKNKMKKVEDFLETCEIMYFGKSINIRNDPVYLKQCSRSPSAISSTARSSRNSIPQGNEVGKWIDPSLLLIRNLILSNNRFQSDSKASQIPSASYDGKGTTKATQNLFNCQAICNPHKSILSSHPKISPLEILSSPLRKPHVLDAWGPKEVCLFEAAICKYGKDFSRIQRIIQTKTTKDMIDFYYLWKKTNRYVAWKEFRCLSETMPVNFFE
ncbi:hypothetical protein IE077_000102 [Cardiosporidium cionae]|uniref:SANT domain-containing protein n=1 Tax=Cardiosporidium cionae TaxID=476202 RepID=A0ABQ7JDF5_9APIC|nr:hypothetical protein IE077_000102 [Cardiosporidium cionae]|eukprot:KAF8822035.1 hypothetical protein IE077_000102 [Cardiosporidium cionae]